MKKLSVASYTWNIYSLDEEKRVMSYHEHNSIEISYVLDGLLTFYYKNPKNHKEEKIDILQNQLLIVLPNVIHKTEIPYNLSCIGAEFVESKGDVSGYFKSPFFKEFLKNNKMIFKNGFLVINGTRKILNYIRQFESYTSQNLTALDEAKLDLLIKCIFVEIWEANAIKETIHKNKFYKKAVLFIEDNYHKNIKVEDVVNVTRASKSYLQLLFKANTGSGIKNFIDQTRIDKSKDILKETSYSVNAIAKIVGFNSPQIYIDNFKKRTNLTPNEYRKKLLEEQKVRFFKDNGSYKEKKYR